MQLTNTLVNATKDNRDLTNLTAMISHNYIHIFLRKSQLSGFFLRCRVSVKQQNRKLHIDFKVLFITFKALKGLVPTYTSPIKIILT